jgi:DNA repair exonuclease SbcCD ATPase subunit
MNFMIEKFGDNLCTDAELTIKGSNEQLSPVLRLFYIQLPLAKEEENAEYVTSLKSWTYILHNMEALNLPRYSDNKIFNYLKEVTDVAALSPEQRRRYERDLTNYWDACALDEEYERRDKEFETREKEIESKKKEIESKKKEFETREKEIESKKKEIEKVGITKGETQKAISIARNMRAENLPTDMIAKMTGLSIEEINAISLN